MNIDISEYIGHPERLNKETLYGLRELVARYPYFQAARLMFLQNLFLLHDPAFGEELRRAAILLPDRRVLFKMVEGQNYELQSFKKAHATDEGSTPANRTQNLIDQFLHSTLPADDVHGRRITVADATSDYTAFLQEMEDINPVGPSEGVPIERSTKLIDSYIENKPQRIVLSEEVEFMPDIPEEQDETIDEGFFTEALAKIYIKQGRYEKALEIIRKLNLNYPKKNSYFADQIRFLQKLIINNKTKK